MDLIGDRKYVEIPGDRTLELPPLLVRGTPEVNRLDRVLSMAASVVESEDMVPSVPGDEWAPESDVERRKMDLAINLVEQYLGLLAHWRWGDSVLEWIRQCEITFESRTELRPLLHPDVWPHAGRRSFVELLADKGVLTRDVTLEKAVGLRLTFRQPPPLRCFSDQFLFYLNSPVASSAYLKWAEMTPEPLASLPPERFHFEVVQMAA
jgi:hypothetical protein